MMGFMRRALGLGQRKDLNRRWARRCVRLELQELETRALPSTAPGFAVVNLDAQPLASSASAVYTPQQIRHAYGFDAITLPGGLSADGSGQTIAIVDAFDAPNIFSDLHHFDAQFGLPDPALIKATPGGGTPAPDAGWAAETTLDVEWAHAIAPKATILLVETASNSFTDLLAGVDYARNYGGVSAVSMSWGGGEFSGETALDAHFTTPAGHTGVTFVAASGDNGAWYGPDYPATSPNVLSVGGTVLHLTTSGNYSSESGWSGSTGGYSSFESEPAYQRSAQGSGVRTSPDVAYNASPGTGVYAYYTQPGGSAGWYSFGGTSAGAPQWAALVAIADQGRAAVGEPALAGAQSAIYNLPSSDFHDITSGSNGYRAHTGYDLVTGRGTPKANLVVSGLIGTVTTSATAHSLSTPSGGSTTTSSGSKAQPRVTPQDNSIQLLLLSGMNSSAAVTLLATGLNLRPRTDTPVVPPSPPAAAPSLPSMGHLFLILPTPSSDAAAADGALDAEVLQGLLQDTPDGDAPADEGT
jgi:subtilase family serine protease